ncbi:MAG: CidA/LrgA family protein [Clostridia bacterium]|nr:CidA/LrgA family protein [Clostridia bacterium]MBQ6614412.1 CidA/LrgA family protein [Clostridia bacterium]
MKYIKQLTILVILSLISEFFGAVIPLPIPAPVYGIVLTFILLETKILPLSAIEETSRYLITIMPIMFIPPAIRLVDLWDVLKPIWLPCVLIAVSTTFAIMFVSGRVTQAVIRHSEKKEDKKNV